MIKWNLYIKVLTRRRKTLNNKPNNLFWNIKDDSKVDKATLIEHTIKYGDLDDIRGLFEKIDKKDIKQIWLKTMAWDERFLKINHMIARIFLDMDVESDFFKGLKSGRFKTRVSVR